MTDFEVDITPFYSEEIKKQSIEFLKTAAKPEFRVW